MHTIVRNNYDPHIGDYHNMVVHDEARNKTYFFDCDGVFLEVPKIYTIVADEAGESTTMAISQRFATDNINRIDGELEDKQDKLIAGDNITIVDNVISATGGGGGTGDYEDLDNLPKINDVTLIGNKTLDQLGIQAKGSYVTDANYVHTDNNYTSAEKTKLAGLENYDDTEIRSDIATLEGAVDAIETVIPAQATSSNPLADKAFVNSTVQTGTANFRGNWMNWASVPIDPTEYPADYTGETTPSTNDYMVVQDASGYVDPQTTLAGTWRFKYTGIWTTDGRNGWHPEYQVNETPMSAAQLAALNSGATEALINQITTNEQSIYDLESGKQNALTAGTNISISNDTISATDTTYDDFVGATSSAAGEAGLVPAPTTADADKYLKGDGTWGTVQAGPTVVQTIGTSTADVMSQKAVTEYFYPDYNKNRIVMVGGDISASTINKVANYGLGIAPDWIGQVGAYSVVIGRGAGGNNKYTGTTVIGNSARGEAESTVAIGESASASARGAVAIGYGAHTSTVGAFHIGTGAPLAGYNNTNYRLLTGVYDGQSAHDAATYGQLNSRVPAPTAGDADKFLKGDGTWANAGSASVANHTLYV